MQSTVTLKKYPNRKLYITRGNTEPSGYITVEDFYNLIKKGKNVKVVDSKSGEDITEEAMKACLIHADISTDVAYQLIRGE